MKKYISVSAGVLIVIALLVFGNKDNQKIRIGLVGPFTGNSAAFGEFMQKGLDLATNELSPEQKLHVEIIKEDDSCSGKNAVSVVQKLIQVDHVKYIIGPLCNESSLATEKLFEDSKVISLTVGLPSNAIANMGKYHFSFSPEIEFLMKAVSKKMISNGVKKVAVIHMVSAFEDENYKHFVSNFRALGGEIVADEAEVKGATDFRDAILKAKQAKPDAFMLIAVTGELNTILKQIRVQNMLTLPKYGIHAAETSVILQDKGLADGLIYPYPGDREEIDSASTFAKSFKEEFNSSPNPYSANVYDSFKILETTIGNCGYNNVECVQQHLSNLKDYKGANGSLSVDERGVGTYKEIMLKIVRDGRFEVL